MSGLSSGIGKSQYLISMVAEVTHCQLPAKNVKDNEKEHAKQGSRKMRLLRKQSMHHDQI